MAVRYKSRKKVRDGEIVPEDMMLIQVRIPKPLGRVYSTILSSRGLTKTAHLETMIENFITREQIKLKEEINK